MYSDDNDGSGVSVPSSFSSQLNLCRITEQIYLGTLKDLTDMTFKNYGITSILNLTEQHLRLPSNSKIKCLNSYLPSNSLCGVTKILPVCLTYIDETVQQKRKILICCHDGWSKTLIVIMSYFIMKHNKDYQSTYSQLCAVVPQLIGRMTPECKQTLIQLTKLNARSKVTARHDSIKY